MKREAKMKSDGGPAFVVAVYDSDSQGKLVPREVSLGMTLRDYFAAAALQGLIAHYGNQSCDDAAREAYAHADCLLKERDK